MYQGLGNELDFGLAADVGSDCSITATHSKDEPPCFTFNGPSCSFQLYFDPAALRAFTPIAHKALTTMDPTAHLKPPTPNPSAPKNPNHPSWAWINRGCYMDFIISTPESMFFRFGASANSFEPTFHIQALRRFANLLNATLIQIEPVAS